MEHDDVLTKMYKEMIQLKDDTILTSGEWKKFVEETEYKITKDYVKRVETTIGLLKKYFLGWNEDEIEISYVETNLPDLSIFNFVPMNKIRVFSPSSGVFYDWLFHLFTIETELAEFVKSVENKEGCDEYKLFPFKILTDTLEEFTNK